MSGAGRLGIAPAMHGSELHLALLPLASSPLLQERLRALEGRSARRGRWSGRAGAAGWAVRPWELCALGADAAWAGPEEGPGAWTLSIWLSAEALEGSAALSRFGGRGLRLDQVRGGTTVTFEGDSPGGIDGEAAQFELMAALRRALGEGDLRPAWLAQAAERDEEEGEQVPCAAVPPGLAGSLAPTWVEALAAQLGLSSLFLEAAGEWGGGGEVLVAAFEAASASWGREVLVALLLELARGGRPERFVLQSRSAWAAVACRALPEPHGRRLLDSRAEVLQAEREAQRPSLPAEALERLEQSPALLNTAEGRELLAAAGAAGTDPSEGISTALRLAALSRRVRAGEA